jgi:GcrA cell cycle regulator
MAADTLFHYCVRPTCRVRAVHHTSNGFFCDDHLPFDWTDERIETLKRLFAEGLSGAQIAKAMGAKSRNAIIGKLHRLKLNNAGGGRGKSVRCSQSHINNPKRSAARAAHEPKLRADPIKPRLVEVPAESRPVQLSALRRGCCRWPLDDPGRGHMDQVLFCAAPAVGIYCTVHARIAFCAVPPKGRGSHAELIRSVRRFA